MKFHLTADVTFDAEDMRDARAIVAHHFMNQLVGSGWNPEIRGGEVRLGALGDPEALPAQPNWPTMYSITAEGLDERDRNQYARGFHDAMTQVHGSVDSPVRPPGDPE